jgi:hypothetical protein
VKHVNGFLMVTAAAVLVACATQGPAPSSGTSAVNGNAPTTTVAASATSSTGSSSQFKIPDGYTRVVKSDGTELYCRSETDTGSRVAKSTVCLTAAQLQAQQQGSQDLINSLQDQAGARTY